MIKIFNRFKAVSNIDINLSGSMCKALISINYMILLVLSISCAHIKTNLDKDKNEFAKQQMDQILTALDMYYIDKGEYPSKEGGLDALKNYLSPQEIPSDPWGRKYVYRRDLTGIKQYELFSSGPDKIYGTEDDIILWKLR